MGGKEVYSQEVYMQETAEGRSHILQVRFPIRIPIGGSMGEKEVHVFRREPVEGHTHNLKVRFPIRMRRLRPLPLSLESRLPESDSCATVGSAANVLQNNRAQVAHHEYKSYLNTSKVRRLLK